MSDIRKMNVPVNVTSCEQDFTR